MYPEYRMVRWRPFSDGRGGNCITWPPVNDEMDHRPNYVQTLVCATMLSLCGPIAHIGILDTTNKQHNKQHSKQTNKQTNKLR